MFTYYSVSYVRNSGIATFNTSVFSEALAVAKDTSTTFQVLEYSTDVDGRTRTMELDPDTLAEL